MSRTKRHTGKLSEMVRTVNPYKRQRSRRLLKEFEQEYIGKNQNPLIEL